MGDIKLPEPFDTICVLHEHGDLEDVPVFTADQLREYAKQAAELEREAIAEEFWSCLLADMESGVKWLNETAAKEFKERYPRLHAFGGWLNDRGTK